MVTSKLRNVRVWIQWMSSQVSGAVFPFPARGFHFMPDYQVSQPTDGLQKSEWHPCRMRLVASPLQRERTKSRGQKITGTSQFGWIWAVWGKGWPLLYLPGTCSNKQIGYVKLLLSGTCHVYSGALFYFRFLMHEWISVCISTEPDMKHAIPFPLQYSTIPRYS